MLAFIVVLIVFLLIGFPHGHARHQARMVQCLSNLRQLGIANLKYAHENKEFIPRGGESMHWAMPAVSMWFRDMAQTDTVNALRIDQIGFLWCPERRAVAKTTFLDYVGNTFDTEKGAENDWQEIHEPTRLDIWKRPSEVLYVGDAALESGTDADGANMNGNLKRFRENKQLDRMSVFNPSQIQSNPNRHAGTKIHLDRFANWVFADGHAESIKWNKGQRTTKEWLRMYGVDDAGKDQR